MKIKNKAKFHRFILAIISIALLITNIATATQLKDAKSHKQIIYIIKPEDETAKRKQELEKANKEIAEIARLKKLSINWK